MKYIKKFETVNQDKPQIGDYVILDIDKTPYRNLSNEILNRIDKLNNSICLITGMNNTKSYRISEQWAATITDIKYWSKYKEDLEPLLQANKYNI